MSKNKKVYYYPLWDDSLKLDAEQMIEYLLNENYKIEKERNKLEQIIREVNELSKKGT